ncbi:hypothetical protein HJG60_012136 [Phyllostomus discolor]|uniref:Uncharacterized protein n=1 Tax=Phyllostomus discolor TaxID=89673 RepID=A0A833ZJV5_9CHIR|nr:hypothetical protein HJG60_012136 [Phyllostomus discolor]
MRTRSACPVLRVGHREETAVRRTRVSVKGSAVDTEWRKGAVGTQRWSPKCLLVPCGKRPLRWGGETEPRIQMQEVLESATQQGLSKQRAADGAEKKHTLCSSVPDVNSKCQQKILRKGKAKFCKRHRTPALPQCSENQTESLGSKHPLVSLGWSQKPPVALAPPST